MSGRHLVVRRGRWSVRADARASAVVAVLALAIAAALTVHVGRGEYPIAPGDVLSALAGGGDRATRFVVLDLRLPRALAAALVGLALGAAGLLFQDVARNPLAAPDLLGISSGASVAAVALIVLGDEGGGLTLPLAAAGGALAAGALLHALAWHQGLHGQRLVLVGVGLTAVLQAGVSYLLTHGRILDVTQAYVWLVGSLNGRSWEQVRPLAAALVVLLPVALVLMRRLAALQLGDDVARALGVRVDRTRAALLAVGVLLTGVAVSAAGPIAFVAFFAPHLARRLCRTVSPGAVLLAAGACGALIVVAADLAGRLLLAPTELPVGIVTSVLAAPYFLLLLVRAERAGAAA